MDAKNVDQAESKTEGAKEAPSPVQVLKTPSAPSLQEPAALLPSAPSLPELAAILPSASPFDDEANDGKEPTTPKKEKSEEMHKLGISAHALAKIPSLLHSSISSALLQAEPPICSITLDPILDEDTRLIRPGMVCLVQKHRAGGPSDFHVFFFTREAIESWFGASRQPTNPSNRESVNLATQYFVLS